MFIFSVEFTIRATHCGLPQAEKQQGRQFNEICRIHRYICKESRKMGRANDEKGGGRSEKARPIIENEHQDAFSFFVLNCDAGDILIFLTSLLSTNHDLVSFQIIVSKLEGWKCDTFTVGLGQHLALLRH